MKKINSGIQFLTYWVSFTCLAIVVRGYEYGTGDQVLQIPLLKKIINPQLYMSDTLFPALYTNKTILYLLIAGLNKIIPDLETVFFLIYFITQFLFFIGIYLLSTELMSSKQKSFLSCLLFIYPLPVAGSATNTVDKLFLPRTMAMMMSVYCLYYIFKNKTAFVLIIISLIFLIHPLTGIILLVLSLPLVFSIWSIKNKMKILLWSIPTCLFGGAIFVLLLQKNIGRLFGYFAVSDNWLEILHLRNTYAFPLMWNYRGWLNLTILVIPIVYILYAANGIKNPHRNYISYVLFTSLSVLILQIFFTSVYPIPIVILLQLGRIWIIPIYLSLIYITNIIPEWILGSDYIRTWGRVLIIIFLLMLAIIRKNSYRLQDEDWVSAQSWVRKHTNSSCVVFVNFYSQGFRVYSERSILGEYKDGTISFYSPDFALEWNKRRLLLSTTSMSDKKDLRYLRDIYPYSLVISKNDLQIPLTRLYKNSSYSVFRTEKIQNTCEIYI